MKRPHANILIHQSSYYRRHTFAEGLKKHGYEIINNRNIIPRKDDLVIAWNRNHSMEPIIKRYAKAGAKIAIAENGYINNADGSKMIALAMTHHNGIGDWHVGEEDRWGMLGQALRPWRDNGKHVLILPQRGIGEKNIAMPRNWEESVLRRLRRHTDRPLLVRKHPGKNKCQPLEHDLKNAWCAVTWGSGAGVKSIINGIPVFHDLNNWIGQPAASRSFDIENPFLGDRSEMLHRMAWAQWSWKEIHDGTPWEYLLRI